MKFNYALPYNASYLTDSYVRYDRSISPGVEVDGDDEPNPDYQGITTHSLSISFSLSSFFRSSASGISHFSAQTFASSLLSSPPSPTSFLSHEFFTPSEIIHFSFSQIPQSQILAFNFNRILTRVNFRPPLIGRSHTLFLEIIPSQHNPQLRAGELTSLVTAWIRRGSCCFTY